MNEHLPGLLDEEDDLDVSTEAWEQARAEADRIREQTIDDYKARAAEVAANITTNLRAKGILSHSQEVVFDVRVRGL